MPVPLRCDVVFQAVLSMDSARPLWIYFAIAIPCIVLTAAVLVTLSWIYPPTDTTGKAHADLQEELEKA